MPSRTTPRPRRFTCIWASAGTGTCPADLVPSAQHINHGDTVMRKSIVSLVVATAFATPAFAQESVEVLHWWTSGGEASALNVLKGMLEKQGVTWHDMPVAGGGGEAAMTAVRARVTAGNPPTAVQMLGFDILDWAKGGVLADLNDVAAKNNWDKTVPPAIQKFSKYKGMWIAAPVNI